VLRTRISDGNAPDVAIMLGIGFLRSFVADGQIKPLRDLGMDRAATEAAFAPGSLAPAVINNELYAVMMKLSSKSVVWYKPNSFKEQGFQTPATYEDMVKITDAYRAKGKKPWAVGTKDSWTLTDWFESIYLLQAGADKYDQLFSGKIAFTEPATAEFMKFLTTVEAGNVAAETGVFTSPLKAVDAGKYPTTSPRRKPSRSPGPRWSSTTAGTCCRPARATSSARSSRTPSRARAPPPCRSSSRASRTPGSRRPAASGPLVHGRVGWPQRPPALPVGRDQGGRMSSTATPAQGTTATDPARRRGRRRRNQAAKPKWGAVALFLGPALVLLAFFLLYPAIHTVRLSLYRGRLGEFTGFLGLTTTSGCSPATRRSLTCHRSRRRVRCSTTCSGSCSTSAGA
jgi:extracellular solute-binding protein